MLIDNELIEMTLNLSFFSLPAQENAKRSSAAPSRIQIIGAPHFLISSPPKKDAKKNSNWRFFISQILKLFCSQNVTEHENLQIRTCELSERLLKTPEQSNQYVIFTNYQLLFNLHYCLFVCLSIVITSD